MKKLFQAIRKSDIETVKQLLEQKPELVHCTAKQPPKKDDGQSPLQVALKTGNLEIASYLLDMGADVNFMESEDCCNEWRSPVIHDAIVAAIMNSRWNTNSSISGFEVFSTKEKADQAYEILKRMLEAEADVNAKDSYGISCLWRFCQQARQILPTYNHVEQKLSDNRIMTDEIKEDLVRIYSLLLKHDMDLDYIAPMFSSTARELYEKEPLCCIFNCTEESVKKRGIVNKVRGWLNVK